MGVETDRELLELAAKAAGVHFEWNGDSPVEVFGRWNGNPSEPPEQDHRDWNPLTDDGAALRLAAALGMKVGILHGGAKSTYVSLWVSDNRAATVERHGDDMMAATRRAIVRDAAEIGRAM